MDIFRKGYRILTEKEKILIDSIKTKAEHLCQDFIDAIDQDKYDLTCGREIALAKTHLEESIMWAVKGITK